MSSSEDKDLAVCLARLEERLFSIDRKLDESLERHNIRLNDHSTRLRLVERFVAGALALAAFVGGLLTWALTWIQSSLNVKN